MSFCNPPYIFIFSSVYKYYNHRAKEKNLKKRSFLANLEDFQNQRMTKLQKKFQKFVIISQFGDILSQL